MRRLIYMAHAVAPTEKEIDAARIEAGINEPWTSASELAVRRNIESALRCLAWLRSSFFETTFIAPWIAGVQAVGGDGTPEDRERGLINCCAVVERCDGIVHMGRRISSGMRREMEHGQFSKFVRFQPWDNSLVSGVVTCNPFSFKVYDLVGIDVALSPVQVGKTFLEFMEARR